LTQPIGNILGGGVQTLLRILANDTDMVVVLDRLLVCGEHCHPEISYSFSQSYSG
jgi:hypothetical protein